MEHEFAARERKRDFLYFHFWPWCYRLFSKRPVQKKLAVFANDCVRSLPDNMQCLYDELRRRGYRCILCLKPKHAGNPISAQVRSFCNYLRFIYYYAHCRCVFLSDYISRFIPSSRGREPGSFSFGMRAVLLRSGAIPHSATLGAIRKAV